METQDKCFILKSLFDEIFGLFMLSSLVGKKALLDKIKPVCFPLTL